MITITGMRLLPAEIRTFKNKEIMKTIKIFTFNNSNIEFIVNEKDNVMINATQMAKVYNRRVVKFTENQTTKDFIKSCLNSPNSDYLNVENEKDLIFSKQKTGTLMHEVLALKFAAWLNPDFEVWVFTTIRDLLNKYAKKQGASIKRTLEIEKEQTNIKTKLVQGSEDFRRFLQLEKALKKEKSNRRLNTISEFENQRTIVFK